jgi:hypothetical protein
MNDYENITSKLLDWDNNPTRTDCSEEGSCLRCEAVDYINDLRGKLVDAQDRIEFLDAWVKELIAKHPQPGHTPLS